jgi:hypothetical protein
LVIILIAGGTRTGKTPLSQRLLEKYGCPCLSIDLLKTGLIRSGVRPLSPESPGGALTGYLWPLVREIIKASIENDRSLIVEGRYISFDYAGGFTEAYLKEIRYVCLIFSSNYITRSFGAIKRFENAAERRRPLAGAYVARKRG